MKLNEILENPINNIIINERNGKNTHLVHLEDLIFRGGIQGIKKIIEHIKDITNMLQGKGSRGLITTKWDGCIHEDTIIITDKGNMTIKKLINSDYKNIKVLAKNLLQKEDIWVKIINTNVSKSIKNWIEIELEDNTIIKLTEDHKVHTINREWIKAKDLTEDDQLTSSNF